MLRLDSCKGLNVLSRPNWSHLLQFLHVLKPSPLLPFSDIVFVVSCTSLLTFSPVAFVNGRLSTGLLTASCYWTVCTTILILPSPSVLSAWVQPTHTYNYCLHFLDLSICLMDNEYRLPVSLALGSEPQTCHHVIQIQPQGWIHPLTTLIRPTMSLAIFKRSQGFILISPEMND